MSYQSITTLIYSMLYSLLHLFYNNSIQDRKLNKQNLPLNKTKTFIYYINIKLYSFSIMIKLKNKNYNKFIDTYSGLVNVSHIVRCYYDTYKQGYMVDVDQNFGEYCNIVSYPISKETYNEIYSLFRV